MDQKLLKAIALLDIGQNLVIGDIHVDLIDTLTQEEFEAVTNFRKQIGQHFIEQSGLPNNIEWNDLISTIRLKQAELSAKS